MSPGEWEASIVTFDLGEVRDADRDAVAPPAPRDAVREVINEARRAPPELQAAARQEGSGR